MAVYKTKCEVCGCEFETRSRQARYCTTCKQVTMNVRSLARMNGSHPTHDEFIAICRERIANGSTRSKHERGKLVRCKYCGHETRSETGYCKTCRQFGLDDLNAVTGRTNGWDKEEHHLHGAHGGWRGQRLMGGCAARWFPGRLDWLGR